MGNTNQMESKQQSDCLFRQSFSMSTSVRTKHKTAQKYVRCCKEKGRSVTYADRSFSVP